MVGATASWIVRVIDVLAPVFVPSLARRYTVLPDPRSEQV